MNTQYWSRVGKFRVTVALVYGWWSCEELQSDIVSDLLRKLQRFRHAVVEPSFHGVLRSLARFRALARVGAVFCCFPSSVVSSISVCASGHLMRHVHGSRHSARFMSHPVVRTHPDVSFHHYFEQKKVKVFCKKKGTLFRKKKSDVVFEKRTLF